MTIEHYEGIDIPEVKGLFDYTDDTIIVWYDGPLVWFATLEDGTKGIVMWHSCEMDDSKCVKDQHIAYLWDPKSFLVAQMKFHDVDLVDILPSAERIICIEDEKIDIGWKRCYIEIKFDVINKGVLPQKGAKLFC
jgi:hypothetical protein